MEDKKQNNARGCTAFIQNYDSCGYYPIKKYSDIMQGERWFGLLNTGFAFPENVEGYWRAYPEAIKGVLLPYPIICQIEGYDKEEFLHALKELERLSLRTNYRGFSLHRHFDTPNGNAEFFYRGWKWPEGYKSYIELGVPPSRAFHLFITGVDNPNLPDYGRKPLETSNETSTQP